jgi:prepilin-type N-terminal cleavage/methylation domain-containing protein
MLSFAHSLSPIQRRKSEKGFTIIELLVVVLIVAILAAIAIPIYLNIQTNAYKSGIKQDVNNTVKKIQVALSREKANLADIKSNNGAGYYTISDAAGNEKINVKDSTTAPGDPTQYQVEGTESTTAGGRFTWLYWYDSALGTSGKYQESNSSSIPTDFAPTITSAEPGDTGVVGTAYAYTSTATGHPNATFTATGLPTGLTMSSAGVISGTPTAAGIYNYVITASNNVNPDATQNGTITITPKLVSPQITTSATLPAGQAGVTYAGFTVTATGYPAPTFSAPGLPAGLSINSGTGVISGIPTTAGTTNFVITANNGVDPAGTQNATIVVAAAAPVSTTLCKTTGNCLVTTEIVNYKGEYYWGFNVASGTVAANSVFYVCFIQYGSTDAGCTTQAIVTAANSVVNGTSTYYAKFSNFGMTPNDPITCISLSTASNVCGQGTINLGTPKNALDKATASWTTNPIQTVDYYNFQKYTQATSPISVEGSCQLYSSSTTSYGFLVSPGTTGCAGTGAGTVTLYGGTYYFEAGKTYTVKLEAEKYNGNGTPTALNTVCFQRSDINTGSVPDDCTSQSLVNQGGAGTTTNYQTLTYTFTQGYTAQYEGGPTGSGINFTFAKPAGSATTSRIRLGQFSITANN